jgi:hypothetical protein
MYISVWNRLIKGAKVGLRKERLTQIFHNLSIWNKIILENLLIC